MSKEILTRQISGALRCCIATHGDIHKKWVRSAAKRIAGNLDKLNKFSYPNELIKEQILVLMAEEHKSLVLIRKRFDAARKDDWGTRARLSGEMSCKRQLLIKLEKILARDAKDKSDTQPSQ